MTRLEAADGDTVIAVYHQPEAPNWINIGYAVVVRDGESWKSQAGGGTTIHPRAGDKVQVDAGPPTPGPGYAFVYGYLIDPNIHSVRALFADGERREDQPENRLFIFVFNPEVPPCQLGFLDGNESLIKELDLTERSLSGGLTLELMENAQKQCLGESF